MEKILENLRLDTFAENMISILGAEFVSVINIAIMIIGLVICFSGNRLIKFIVALGGFSFGYSLGCSFFFALIDKYSLDEQLFTTLAFVLAIALGVLCAFLAARFVYLGFFLYGLTASYTVLMSVACPQIIAVILAIIFGVLAIFLARVLVVVISAINGGMAVGNGIVWFIPSLLTVPHLNVLIGAVLAVLGMLTQFKEHRHRKDA